MRLSFLILLLVIGALSTSFAEEAKVIKDDTDEINYSLGIELGRKLKEKTIEFRPEALWQGVYDGVRSSDPYLSEEMIQQILQNLSGEEQKVAEEGSAQVPQRRVSKEVAGYRLKGQKFLAENEKNNDVIKLNNGMQYKVLKTGQGKKPKKSDSVLVNYKAKTIEGNVFNSSFPLGIPTPTEFKVDGLIPGLTEILPMMQEGDKWEVYIPTRLAFKDFGPMAGQTVIYELELLEILPEFRDEKTL